MMPSSTFENLNPEKKSRVMAALLTEFSNHSLADAQVARIVVSAGIARGAFYKYFDDLTDAYQTLYQSAMTMVHRDVETAPTSQFKPQLYYDAVVRFVDHFTASPYEDLIRRHYAANESLLPEVPIPVHLPTAAWSAMILSHATIKEIILRPDNRNVALARFQQALALLAE